MGVTNPGIEITFEYVDVKDEIQKKLKKLLQAYSFGSVKVLKADPQTPAEVPCIGINRIDDNEDSQSIADAQGTTYDKVTQVYRTIQGTFFSEAIEVRIWHTNADERDKLYHTVKALLFAIRPDFIEKGLLNISLRGGRDEQDSSMAQAPMVLYWATLTMTYLNPLDVNIIEIIEPITSILDNPTLQP
jgi:hypothetical protein